MPGTAHEVLIVALREQPSLLGVLVAKLTGILLPRGFKPVDSVVRFVKTAEVRPDLLFFLKRRKRWVIVELQGRPDPEKRRRWLLAASVLLDQTGALGDVVVITARRDVARWAERVAHHQGQLGTKLSLTPLVLHLGEDEVEALLDEQRPELSLFAAWAMQNRHGPKARSVVERALDLTSRLPAPLRRAHMRAIVSVLSERMLAVLREASMNPDKIPETPAGRKTRLFLEAQGRKRGRIEGEAKGRAEGEAKGRAEGEAKGELKGELKGKRDALLALLKARGLSVSADQRAVVRGCADVAKLDQWIVRAATASSMSEVLRPATRSNSARAPRRRPAGARPRAARRT
jgi:hypothetical protein